MITKRETPQAISRTEAKTRLVVRVKMCVSSGNYARAAELLRGAAAEFPNDAELSELQKLATDGIKRKTDADRLITESQELFSQQKSAKAIQLLRQAYDLDKSNSLACSILANALVEHAQSIVESDWWEAETLANEALALNPVHPTAKKIFGLILDQKTTSSVEVWVSQTRKLHTSGNLTAALSQIAEGFSVYPREPRLLQMQDAIQREHSAQRRQARRRDLEDLRRSESEIDAVADVASKIGLAERIEAVAAKHSTDGEILSIANRLLQRLGSLDVPQKSSNTSRDSKGTTHAPPPSSAPKAAVAAASEPPASPVLPSPVSTSSVSQSPVSQSPVSPSAVSSSPVLPSQITQSPIPPKNAPSGVVTPSGITPSRIAPSNVPLRTAPRVIAPPVLVPRVTARPDKVPSAPPEPQLPAAQTAAVPAAESAAVAAKVTSPSAEPKHSTRSNSTTLIIASVAVIILVAAIFFFAGRHYAPSVAKTPAAALAVPAPTISAPPVAASAVSTPAVSTPAHTPEPSLPASQSSSGTVVAEATPDGQLPADVRSNGTGALMVVADQDNAKVFIDGKLQRQLTQAGHLRLPNLGAKDYVVQVSKSGFQDPPQQRISIRKGEQAKLSFNLQPNPQPQPRLASLTIQGGAAGTSVLVDQALVGTIQTDGTLSVSNVNPGDHTIELRREQFKPRQFKKHFVAGGAISLVAADAVLEAASSELKINFAPTDAKVVIAKTGVLPTMVSSGVPLNLAAGTYTLTARNADGFTRYSTLEVIAGQSRTLDLSLAANGMSKWENQSGWKHEGDSFIRKGGDFVLYGVIPASGTFMFSAMVTKGHLLQWVVDCTDPKNYVLFQMDENGFYRAVIRNGVRTDEFKVADRGDKKSFRALRIRVSPTEIVHQIKHGDRWTALDRWTQPGVNLGAGKFGFYIPGNDEVALSGFAHYVDLSIR